MHTHMRTHTRARSQAEFRGTPITAVTATATSAVQQDILSTLGIARSVTVHQVSLRARVFVRCWPDTHCSHACMRLCVSCTLQHVHSRATKCTHT
jgi:superfamily II DNA helicase RecQ